MTVADQKVIEQEAIQKLITIIVTKIDPVMYVSRP